MPFCKFSQIEVVDRRHPPAWQDEAREKTLSLVGEESGDNERKALTCPKFTLVAKELGDRGAEEEGEMKKVNKLTTSDKHKTKQNQTNPTVSHS